MKRQTMKEYIAKVDTKLEALVLVGNLLAGNIQVDIDTNEIEEATKFEQLFDTEFSDMLKAIGAENVPVEILARCGKRTATKEADEITIDEITIDDVTENMNFNTARGLLHDLIIGATQVDTATGIIYWCYGGYDSAVHEYATIKTCVGTKIDACDVYEIYNECQLEAEDMVEKLIKLIRG